MHRIATFSGSGDWPHEPAAVDYHATEGRSWRLMLSADDARTARLPEPGATPATAAGEDPDAADASLRGTAGELVLALYGRIPVDSLKVDGDRNLFDLLKAWEPEEQDVSPQGSRAGGLARPGGMPHSFHARHATSPKTSALRT